ncbi:NfeD family protein [Paenibacillus mesotrionivorans]|uniref:NfeD family protein n=1 Tax=Paenibacillus mesotrionivorans TaxID=3160968 RepID=A0ACC7P062_9BACL
MNTNIRLKAWLMGLLAVLMLIPAGITAAGSVKAAGETQNGAKLVYYIPAERTIESGLQRFLQRAYKDAEEHQASYIVLDVNTLGGRVDAAMEIGELIKNSKVPTAAFVRGKAFSAGSFIALNAKQIYMEPGSTIGAAAVVDGTGEELDTNAKTVAAWSSAMRSAAEQNGRNPAIAEGMVNKNRTLAVPQLNKEFRQGELISLTSEEALKVGYAEGIAGSQEEVLKALGLEGAQVEVFNPSFSENLARFLLNPVVTTILFILGLAGIAIELFVPGFGIPGFIGAASFVLYFFGQYVAGFAGVEDVVLFIIGIILLVIEIFVPGFGIWAIIGIICLMSGVIMAAYDSSAAALSLGIGFILAMVLAGFVIYAFRKRGIWNKFILKDELKTELGYVSQPVKEYLLGKTGKAMTSLRPAGTAVFDGERVDVVTAGEFIQQGQLVKVVLVEGGRIVVSGKEE